MYLLYTHKMSDLSCMVKSMEPWLVVVCTLCLLWLVSRQSRTYVRSNFANPFPPSGGLQLAYQTVDGANQVRSEGGSSVYGSSAGGQSGFYARKQSNFMSEPPVFYPGIGEVQDAAGSFTDMANQGEAINEELSDQTVGADGFKRQRSGFKRHTSTFSGTNLLKALGGGQ
jgi:hypothetical protein